MKIHYYVLLCVISIVVGVGIFCISHELIVIYIPKYSLSTYNKSTPTRTMKLYYWQEGIWHEQVIDSLAFSDIQEYITTLLSAWLVMMHEEQLFPYPIGLQSVLCSVHGDTVYLSFNGTFIQRNKSTYHNLMLVESLLRTLRENNIDAIRYCRFLVNHTPMIDTYFDFSQPWPIEGFIKRK
ncbi:MAG TPA: hypothetical protein VGW78_02005 [Candidatus Babeliales bacterium]|jgi:hypothetical protein|nr:hypothetical protein [Candidatus Babeliales bacterium]